MRAAGWLRRSEQKRWVEAMLQLARFRLFIGRIAELVEARSAEKVLIARASEAMRDLIRQDDWLPAEWSAPGPDKYRQYLLYCDARERFSVVSFVWAPGQSTPIHNHQTWGVIGMLRGAELSQSYRLGDDGRVQMKGPPQYLKPGDIEVLAPTIGDIHHVENPSKEHPSVSIHVYGANIGAMQRKMFTADGQVRPFVTGYSNSAVPNFWQDTVA